MGRGLGPGGLVVVPGCGTGSAGMSWASEVAAWAVWLRAAGRPETTIRLRRYQVLRFADVGPLDPWRTTTAQVVAWLGAAPWAVETKRSHRAALVAFFSWGQATGRVEENPAALAPPIRPAHHPPRPAPEDAVVEGLGAADVRTRLMVALAARMGLRRGEVARMRGDALAWDGRGWVCRVEGKGARVRVIPMPDDLAAAVRSRGPGWTFPGRDGGHLSPARVGELVSAALPEGWTAHTLRHRFATRAYAGSRDLLAVQDLLGHAKPETTRGYVLPPADAMREAMAWAA